VVGVTGQPCGDGPGRRRTVSCDTRTTWAALADSHTGPVDAAFIARQMLFLYGVDMPSGRAVLVGPGVWVRPMFRRPPGGAWSDLQAGPGRFAAVRVRVAAVIERQGGDDGQAPSAVPIEVGRVQVQGVEGQLDRLGLG
jgi:hypothetical protein